MSSYAYYTLSYGNSPYLPSLCVPYSLDTKLLITSHSGPHCVVVRWNTSRAQRKIAPSPGPPTPLLPPHPTHPLSPDTTSVGVVVQHSNRMCIVWQGFYFTSVSHPLLFNWLQLHTFIGWRIQYMHVLVHIECVPPVSFLWVVRAWPLDHKPFFCCCEVEPLNSQRPKMCFALKMSNYSQYTE